MKKQKRSSVISENDELRMKIAILSERMDKIEQHHYMVETVNNKRLKDAYERLCSLEGAFNHFKELRSLLERCKPKKGNLYD